LQGNLEKTEDGLKITSIDCHFTLEIPKAKRAAAERALHVFERYCPLSQSIKGSIDINISWEIIEYEESES